MFPKTYNTLFKGLLSTAVPKKNTSYVFQNLVERIYIVKDKHRIYQEFSLMNIFFTISVG